MTDNDSANVYAPDSTSVSSMVATSGLFDPDEQLGLFDTLAAIFPANGRRSRPSPPARPARPAAPRSERDVPPVPGARPAAPAAAPSPKKTNGDWREGLAPSDKQLEYIDGLMSRIDPNVPLGFDVEVTSMASASGIIDRLKAHIAEHGEARTRRASSSNVPPGGDEGHGVPAGRYALPKQDGGPEELSFFVVDRPEEGRWAGRVFVNVMASDEKHPVRGRARDSVLQRIAADARGAALLYGQTIGVCSVCGRTLTDSESRAQGIGPVCRSKNGW